MAAIHATIYHDDTSKMNAYLEDFWICKNQIKEFCPRFSEFFIFALKISSLFLLYNS